MCNETPVKKPVDGGRKCEKCGATDFRMLDDQAVMACGSCGHVLHDHVENVEQEYEDQPHQRQRIKVKRGKDRAPKDKQSLTEDSVSQQLAIKLIDSEL